MNDQPNTSPQFISVDVAGRKGGPVNDGIVVDQTKGGSTYLMATVKGVPKDALALAITRLREMFPETSRVATFTLHGKGSRDYIEILGVATYNGLPEVVRATQRVATILGVKMTEQGIPVNGYGFDKAHEIVYRLAQKLYGDPQALTVDRTLSASK